MDAHLNEHEIAVLRRTSTINGVQYLPFIPADLAEPMNFSLGFTDKAPRLKLAPKQKVAFEVYKRPCEFMKNPQVIVDLDCMHLRQTIISDCSFVSSCAVAAQYEKRFNKPLISRFVIFFNRLLMANLVLFILKRMDVQFIILLVNI